MKTYVERSELNDGVGKFVGNDRHHKSGFRKFRIVKKCKRENIFHQRPSVSEVRRPKGLNWMAWLGGNIGQSYLAFLKPI